MNPNHYENISINMVFSIKKKKKFLIYLSMVFHQECFKINTELAFKEVSSRRLEG